MEAPASPGSPALSPPSFPLILSIPEPLHPKLDDHKFMQALVTSTGVERIHWAKKLENSEYREGLVYIYDEALKNKLAVFHQLCAEMGAEAEIKVLIPQNMVSQTIGKDGLNIKRLQMRTDTKIRVIDAVKGLEERLVSISGKAKDIEMATEAIHRAIVERKAMEPRDKFTPKFVVLNAYAGHFIGKGGQFTKSIKERYGVDIKVWKSELPVQEDEEVAVMHGKPTDRLDAITDVIRKLDEAMTNFATSPMTEATKMVVPKYLQAKLLNPQGTMLREVATKCHNVEFRVIGGTPEAHEFVIEMTGPQKYRVRAAKEIVSLLEDIKTAVSRSSSRHKPRSRSRSRSPSVTLHVAINARSVPSIIGKNGDNVKTLKTKTRCNISFDKPVLRTVRTPDGSEARHCEVTGSAKAVAMGVRTLLEQVMRQKRETR